MSYRVYVSCDKCGDGFYWDDHTVNISTAGNVARDRGWQVGKKGWYCPECRDVKRRTEA